MSMPMISADTLYAVPQSEYSLTSFMMLCFIIGNFALILVLIAMAMMLYRRACRLRSELTQVRSASRRFRTEYSRMDVLTEKLKNENELLRDDNSRKSAALQRLSQYDPDLKKDKKDQ